MALNNNYTTLLIADHGNCEEMVDPATGEPDFDDSTLTDGSSRGGDTLALSMHFNF